MDRSLIIHIARRIYNPGSFFHWAYLDYIGTDNGIAQVVGQESKNQGTGLIALDVGCGPSQRHRRIFEREGYTYKGLDIIKSPGVTLWDGKSVPMESGSADMVLISWCLHFMEDQRRVIRESHRVLKPEGLIIIVATLLNPISVDDNHVADSKLEKVRLFPEGFRYLFDNDFVSVNFKMNGGIGQIFGWPLRMIFWRFYKEKQGIKLFIAWCLFPCFVLLTLLANTLGSIANALDKTGEYAPSMLITARKSN